MIKCDLRIRWNNTQTHISRQSSTFLLNLKAPILKLSVRERMKGEKIKNSAKTTVAEKKRNPMQCWIEITSTANWSFKFNAGISFLCSLLIFPFLSRHCLFFFFLPYYTHYLIHCCTSALVMCDIIRTCVWSPTSFSPVPFPLSSTIVAKLQLDIEPRGNRGPHRP